MSTLNVSNITDGTTTVGTGYVVNGSAKAWVNFNGTGTIAVRDSLNVSSITDGGTGNYTPNFSSSFANTNYMILTSSTKESGEAFPRSVLHSSGGTKTVSAILIIVEIPDGNNYDNSNINVANLGDLA